MIRTTTIIPTITIITPIKMTTIRTKIALSTTPPTRYKTNTRNTTIPIMTILLIPKTVTPTIYITTQKRTIKTTT